MGPALFLKLVFLFKKNIMANKKIKVEITKGLWGTFDLPYNIGQVVSLEEKLAKEIIEAKYGMPVMPAAKDDSGDNPKAVYKDENPEKK